MSLSEQSLQHVRLSGRKLPSRQPALAKPIFTTPLERSERPQDSLSDEEHSLVSLVLKNAELELADYRVSPLRRRIQAALRVIRSQTLTEGMQQLARNRELSEQVLSALLIGFTLPFRDTAVFQTLRNRVVPYLGELKRPPHVWSAACSQGDELRSLALLLAERTLIDDAYLLGTDTRPLAIQEAMAGGARFWNSVPAPFAEIKEGISVSQWAAMDRLLHWEVTNVFACDDRARWDLISCRNLSIYLEPTANDRLWEKLHAALADNGILVTGKTERPSPSKSWRRWDKCIYQKVDG